MFLVLLGVVILVVDFIDERGVYALAGGGDDDLLGAAFEVGRGPVAAGEHARGLHDDIGADVAPGDLSRVALGEGLDLVVAHVQHVAVVGDVLVPDPVCRVVLEQVRQGPEGHQVVGGHHLDVAPPHGRLGDQHPDPAETVYPYPYGHVFSFSTLATEGYFPRYPND